MRPVQGEDSLIDWLRARQLKQQPPSLIGDDGAILPTAEPWVVTMDSQREGSHFFPGTPPAAVAHRLLAVNLSDLAAMGALPAFAFLALSAPADFAFQTFFTALDEGCQAHGAILAGGDLSHAETCQTVLTLLGRKPASQRWLRRADARPGDRLWVGGTLGQAATGLALLQAGARLEGNGLSLSSSLDDFPSQLIEPALAAVRRHQLPTPQLQLGQWLGQQTDGAAIDISDGLAKDLHRLCKESQVGAEVDASVLPIATGQRALGKYLERDAEHMVLAGGEDYVLLFSLSPDLEPPAHFGCHAIGKIVDAPTITLRRGDHSKALEPLGWDHLSQPSDASGPRAASVAK